MTKNLTWRLKELPTGDDVATLVEQKVITKEEARDLLFSKTKQEDKPTIEALKKQIEFLEGLVRELANNGGNTTYVYKYVDTWTPKLPYVVWNSYSGTDASTTMATYSSSLLNN